MRKPLQQDSRTVLEFPPALCYSYRMKKMEVFAMRCFRWLSMILAILVAICSCAGLAEQEASDANPLAGLSSAVTEENRADYDFTDRAMEYLTFIGENYPDRSESESAHDAFGDWLMAELEASGYAPAQIEAQLFSGEDMFGDPVQGRNIVLTVPGKRDEGQIIVGAHYDGTGIGDNGSGVALLLATAAGLAHVEPEFTLKYVFFDREEEGRVGSRAYAAQMSDEAVASTLCMINLDALVFGDFCNIYGGVYGDDYDADYIAVYEDEEAPQPEPEQLEGYAFAADTAERLGFRVYRPEDLDGVFEANGRGMEPEEAFFTNPWTYAHPAPQSMEFIGPSPTTIGASDHAPFAVRGIPYIYFEATNWWAEGLDSDTPYMGYVETYDVSKGDGGQFMNTDYDTLENLRTLFPGRAEQHYRLFSPLLSALLLAEA